MSKSQDVLILDSASCTMPVLIMVGSEMGRFRICFGEIMFVTNRPLNNVIAH